MRNGFAHFKQTAYALMAQIMKVQSSDSENLARPRKPRADAAVIVWKDALINARHCLDHAHCFLGEIAPNIITDLLPRMLHVAHKDARTRGLLKVTPKSACNLFLPPSAEECKDGDQRHVD